MSGQRISDSGLKLADKADLNRSWDVHMERVFDCANCHYALNNPIYFQEAAGPQPDHLTFDPRRLDLGDYIYRPLHEFAKGQSVQSLQAPGLDNTLRRCESCHSLENTHDWLPYKERHTAALACETCHIPELYAPAVQYVDWTVLNSDSTPVIAYRGTEESNFGADTLLTGYEPILLPRENSDGQTPLAPFNLVTAWYWVYGDPERPIPFRDLQSAWLDGDTYADEVLAQFDADSNGRLSTTELNLDSDSKVTFFTKRLEDLGLVNPRIASEIQPYSINHNVTFGDDATRECSTCHGTESRITQALPLSDRTPGGIVPALTAVSGLLWTGEVQTNDDGTLSFQPQAEAAGLYILGHNAVSFIDILGALAFVGVLIGIFVHGGLRWWFARRQVAQHPAALQEIYMYDVYERLWHWLQTAVILLLLFTGLIIHKPATFGLFSFSYVVQVHNILAAILVINAALSLFYHLASGEIKQFLPRPRGFFDQAVEQSLYYVRGIFRRDPHPFAKTRQHKLNPLQQMTYFAILNVLLPLQIITGALMWGGQRWPETAARLGGLPFLAPGHTLIAWLFATFIVMHVYLTTTGHTPLAGIRAMVMGWDEVEVVAGEAAVEGGD
jgi:thiosulfate reductase cytochrome b subunit